MPSFAVLLDLLRPLELAISAVLVAAHDALVHLGQPPGSGATWALSVVALVLAVRTALLPLTVHQLRSSRRMQHAQPRLAELRARYRGRTDAESLRALAAETRAVHAEVGSSPLGCLPALLQLPVLLALFRVLDGAARGRAVGMLTAPLAASVGSATLAGAPLSGTALDADAGSAPVLAAVLVVLAATTWLTQRWQLTRNTPAAALEGPLGVAQRPLVLLLPAVSVLTGLAVPLGVVLYWATTSCWSLAQQAVVVRWAPAPDSPAEAARRRRRGEDLAPAALPGAAPARTGQRRQPRRRARR